MSNPLHLVLIVLLVTALLLGSATIRAYDVRPIDSPDQPGPVDASMDPDEILTMASVPLGETSYLEMDTTRVYNNSTSEWEPSVTFEFRFDIEDRQAKVTMYFYDDGDRELDNTVYGSTSQFARAFTYEPRPETRDPPSAASWYMDYQDRWTVRAVPGYYLFGEEPRTISADFFDQEWTVADETDDEVILHAEGADIVLPSGPSSEPLEEASSLEVRVDRETGYVSSIVFERHYAEEDRSIREERTFEEWETHEIDQPEELETVGPLEWAWRVAYY